MQIRSDVFAQLLTTERQTDRQIDRQTNKQINNSENISSLAEVNINRIMQIRTLKQLSHTDSKHLAGSEGALGHTWIMGGALPSTLASFAEPPLARSVLWNLRYQRNETTATAEKKLIGSGEP